MYAPALPGLDREQTREKIAASGGRTRAGSEWRVHHTRVQIRSRENFIALNESYPGSRRCTVEQIEEYADSVVTVAEFSDGQIALFAVSFFEVRDC